MSAAPLILALGLVAPQPLQESGGDWPHLRGPALDGGVDLAASGPASLELAWRRPLGPAYAGVVVASGRVLTFASEDGQDALVALSAEDGSELWRRPVGPTYLGHDGSEDGVIPTPVVGSGRVFVIDAHGGLRAFSSEDGAPLWSVDLAGDWGVPEPEYGFGSTPLLDGELLIVQVGASEGRGLCAFAAASGELVWSAALEEAVEYQSPVVMELGGRRQVVALDGDSIASFEPASGELLWRHALGERQYAASGVATRIDDEHFALEVSGQLGCLRVRSEGEAWQTELVYLSRELGRNYAAPVHHDGHIYGFKSSFLTCVEAKSGKRLWKSRPPGGKGLLRLGDRLVVFGAEGSVVLAKASPEGYQEEDRVQALDHTSHSWPSFAKGRIFVRSTNEISCVRLVPTTALAQGGAAGASTEDTSASLMAELASEVLASDDPRSPVDRFLARRSEFPVLEDGLVHFVYRGDVGDLAIAGSMTGGRAEPMQRLPGTDLFHRSYAIEEGARWEYRFQVDYDAWQADPLNPRSVTARRGDVPMSVVTTAGYARGLDERAAGAAAGGRLESFEYESQVLENRRQVQVYLPAGYDAGEDQLPLLIVHQGQDWLAQGEMVHSLDAAIEGGLQPLVVAFVQPIRAWWHEAGGTGTEEYLAMLASEFVPHLQGRYRISSQASERILMGDGPFGLTAIYGALLHPEVFGGAAVRSLSLDDVARHALFALLEGEPPSGLVVYQDWNRYEALDHDRGLDLRADGQRLWQALQAAGYEPLGGEVLDGYGWGSLRAGTGDMLRSLFARAE